MENPCSLCTHFLKMWFQPPGGGSGPHFQKWPGMITDHFLSHLTDFSRSARFLRYGPKMNIFSIDLIDKLTFPVATAPSILCAWL